MVKLTISDGTDTFKGTTVGGTKLDTVSLWHGTTLPTAGTNEVPANGLFLKTDTGELYENTNTKASPTWTKRISAGTKVQAGFPQIPADGDLLLETTLAKLFYGVSQKSAFGGKHWSRASDDSIHFLDEKFDEFASQADADAVFKTTDTTDARVNITDDDLDCKDPSDATHNTIIMDLGAALSDTKWRLRFKITINAIASRTTNFAWVGMGLYSADENIDGATAQDSIHFGVLGSNSGQNKYRAGTVDGAAPRESGSNFTQNAAVETIWVEIKRKTATTCDISIYTDSTFSTLRETLAITPAATCTGLRYLGCKISGRSDPTSNVDVTIDDILLEDNKN